MIPENLIPTRMSGASSNNFNNIIDTMGQPTQPTEADSEVDNPVNELLNRFQISMQTFRDMSTSYKGTEESARKVLQAMAEWLEDANRVIRDSGPSPNTY